MYTLSELAARRTVRPRHAATRTRRAASLRALQVATGNRNVRAWLITFAVIAAALTAVWFVQTHVHVYHGLNAGVAVDAPFGPACAGVEWKGTPGAYLYLNCAALSI